MKNSLLALLAMSAFLLCGPMQSVATILLVNADGTGQTRGAS